MVNFKVLWLLQEDERLSIVFAPLESLWSEVSACLSLLDNADAHAALALQPAAEAFFLVHSCELPQVDSAKLMEHPDAARLIQFAGPFLVRNFFALCIVDFLQKVLTSFFYLRLFMFLFLEKHKNVLNQVLRQNNGSLSDGPFSILIKLPKLLDFDVKRKFFRKQVQKLDERVR